MITSSHRSSVAFLAIAFLSASAIAFADAPAPANLLANPSFESSSPAGFPAEWRADRKAYSLDASVSHSGQSSLKYANDDPARYLLCHQTVPVKPGWKVRLSAWIKTANIAGHDSGATVCLEWTDKKGKWLGGAYPHGVKGTSDWKRVETVTRLPDDAGAVTFSCYVRKGMTGQAWFDDVELVREIEPPMSSVVISPAYRGRIAAAGSPVTARVRLDLRDYSLTVDQLTLTASIQPAAGGLPLARAATRPCSPPQPTDITLAAPALAPGQYDLVLTLLDNSAREIQSQRHKLTQLPPDARFKSFIDEHHRLIVDNKPFFPLGMYWSGITEDDLRIFAQSKFNCIMPYATPSPAQMDLAQRHGVKVIYSVKDWYFGLHSCPKSIKSADDEERLVRQRVREMRDHPALLAWYLNDELGEEYMPRLQAHQRWLAEEDPHHPTWIVLYQVDQVRAYLNTFDVIGSDPYPIGRKPASMAAQWTATTFNQVERARPMWQVPQVFNWANYAQHDAQRTKTGRTPTPAEMRNMAWQCVCEGATGLIFYSWFDIKRNPDVPFDRQWEFLKTIAAEFDRWAPVILSVDPDPAITCQGPRPPWLHCLIRAHDGKTYLFLVNDGDRQGPVSFQLPPNLRHAIETTESRDIPLVSNILTDTLPPQSVRIYTLTP